MRILRFLQRDGPRTEAFETLLSDYRRALFHLADGDRHRLRELKEEIEHELRQVMVRTERLAVAADRDGMLTEVPPRDTSLDSRDLAAYLTIQSIGQRLEGGETLEY